MFKVSVWGLIHLPSDCCGNCDNDGTKHLSATVGQLKMHCRYSWHLKNTWCFLYLFLQSLICRNQIEETLYPHLWVCEQFNCKILVQNGGYSLFQTQSLTLHRDAPGQHKHWSFFPDLQRKMWWKEFLLHIDQVLTGSSKTVHVGVFVIYVLQHNIYQIPQHHDLPWWLAMTSCKEYPFSIHIQIFQMMTQICNSYILQHSSQRNRRSYPQLEGFL